MCELARVAPRPAAEAVGTRADPVMLEVFNNLYMSIAEQMGAVLENTAASVTIKERLDFSCAVFDAAGDLIANAPHMPVHLGSMGASVKAIIAQNPEMAPGDVFVLNAPYNGGTHLPDITVVRPVWDEAGGRVLFFTAARGHHTDVGGLTPGSMPPDSRTIHDEGAYIDNWKLVDRRAASARRRRGRCCSGPSIRCGRRRSTSPTCGRRWRPARRGRRSCGGWWRSSGWRWSRPTCATCRTMPRNACGGRSRR